MFNRPLSILLVVLIIYPFTAEAQFRSRSSYDSKVRDLDNDPVEELMLPILFALTPDDIVSDFGDPRGGGTRSHEGQDMLASRGTPIVSPTEAVVLRTGDGDSSGLYVRTANPGGEQFVYMHLDAISTQLDPGDVLQPGDFIGTVGNTGNAQSVSPHLHFEIRDGREALDPYPRLSDTFNLKESVSFLDGVIDGVKKKADYAATLVALYPSVFREALAVGYALPDEFEDAAADVGIVSEADAAKKLTQIITLIPALLTTDLTLGDQGPAVMLLQLYVIWNGDGAAHDQLAAAGMTGYFGPLTAAALREFQSAHKLTPSGVYDAETRRALE